MLKVFYVIILAFISATFFRLGGSAKNGSWLDFAKNTRIRDIGCPLAFLVAFWGVFGLKIGFWGAYALTFGLSWGAMSTYFSFLMDPPDDVNNTEWFFVGLFYGLSALPLIWAGISWYAIVGRAIILGLMIMWLRTRTGKDFKEEKGSGALLILTIPIFMI